MNNIKPENTSENTSNQNKKSGKNFIVIILISLVMIIAGVAVGFFISNQMNKGNPDKEYDSNVQDIRQDNDTTSSSEEYAENISIPCWDTMIMEADQTEQEVNFYNPEKNKGCDFQLTLALDDGTELWKSQLIPNGKAIYNITLNQALQAGTYKAKIKYDCFTTDGKSLNGSVMNFNLIMEEKTNE
ncbi:MAG TPA: tRNA (uracil-5-)-methyltransferase [Candidatus Merdenecus merdavium]|nr:tRNA (uracil-5-)-methyltransferase [Candidatus Merdenecus merdavium]